MGSTEIVFVHTVIALLDKTKELVRHDVGVYGPSMSGKTTLDKQLTTPGMIRPLAEDKRTHHKKMKFKKQYRMPNATAKRIIAEGKKKTIVSRDIGGHDYYQNMWLKDMFQRKIKTVIIVVDHRHLMDTENTDNQIALGYLVESLRSRAKPKGLGIIKRFTRRNYRPERIVLLANKADEWMVSDEDFELFEKGLILNHRIFDVFREHLFALQEMAIPVHVDAVSAIRNFNVQPALMKGMGFL